MTEFFNRYALCLVLLSIGLFFVVMTYGALIASRAENKHISGVPGVGGVFIFFAFMTTPYKILSLLCLIDYGVWLLPYELISYFLYQQRKSSRYNRLFRQRGYVKKKDKKRKITAEVNGTRYEYVYETNRMLELHFSTLAFAVCVDRENRRYILVDRKSDYNIETVPFDNNSVQLDNVYYGGEITFVNIITV